MKKREIFKESKQKVIKIFCDFCDFEYWKFELAKHKPTNKWICVHCKDKVKLTCSECNSQKLVYRR